MHQAQHDQSTSHHQDDATPPLPPLADPLALLGMGPLGDVLRHQELSLAAKALAIYVLTQPRGRLFTRVEFERLSPDVTSQLDSVLHELVRAGLLAPFPGLARPCCAVTFRLLEDS